MVVKKTKLASRQSGEPSIEVEYCSGERPKLLGVGFGPSALAIACGADHEHSSQSDQPIPFFGAMRDALVRMCTVQNETNIL